MKSPSAAEPPAPAPESEGTGLPAFRTWQSVYAFVIGCFALWVVLLILLTIAFS